MITRVEKKTEEFLESRPHNAKTLFNLFASNVYSYIKSINLGKMGAHYFSVNKSKRASINENHFDKAPLADLSILTPRNPLYGEVVYGYLVMGEDQFKIITSNATEENFLEIMKEINTLVPADKERLKKDLIGPKPMSWWAFPEKIRELKESSSDKVVRLEAEIFFGKKDLQELKVQHNYDLKRLDQEAADLKVFENTVYPAPEQWEIDFLKAHCELDFLNATNKTEWQKLDEIVRKHSSSWVQAALEISHRVIRNKKHPYHPLFMKILKKEYNAKGKPLENLFVYLDVPNFIYRVIKSKPPIEAERKSKIEEFNQKKAGLERKIVNAQKGLRGLSR